jgi:hypothetical protein
MSYYSVSFRYYGPKTNFPCEKPDGTMSDASKACFEAEDICEGACKKLGLNYLHEYSFPDGSIYKYVKDSRSAAKLKELLSGLLPEGVAVNDVLEVSPTNDPWKGGVKTIEEYFFKHGEKVP